MLTALLLIPRQATALPSVIPPTYSSQVVLATKSPYSPVEAYRSEDCASEVIKYDWNTKLALQIMYAESGGNTNTVNDNPRTGDFSVGCYQINILGKLANSRPSEAELKKPHVNVAFAYNLWKSSGWKPWGVCRGVVKCY